MAEVKTDPTRIDDLDDPPKTGPSNWVLIVEDLFPAWRDRLGSSHEAVDELYDLLCDPLTRSARHKVDASGEEIPDTNRHVDHPGFWQDRLLLVADANGGDDHLVVNYGDAYVDFYSPGHWKFFVRRLDVERHERLYFPMVAAPPPRPRQPPRRLTKTSKPDSGAKRRRKPSAAQAAIQKRFDQGDRPPSNVTWPKFCHAVRVEGDGFIGDPKNEKYKRGFTDDTIEEVARELMKSLPRQD
jgi:hypothetical protein